MAAPVCTPVAAAFTRPDGYNVACATLCHSCDGRSFLHLLDPAALEAAFHRHATHPRPEPSAAAEQDGHHATTSTVSDAEGTRS